MHAAVAALFCSITIGTSGIGSGPAVPPCPLANVNWNAPLTDVVLSTIASVRCSEADLHGAFAAYTMSRNLDSNDFAIETNWGTGITNGEVHIYGHSDVTGIECGLILAGDGGPQSMFLGAGCDLPNDEIGIDRHVGTAWVAYVAGDSDTGAAAVDYPECESGQPAPPVDPSWTAGAWDNGTFGFPWGDVGICVFHHFS